MNDYNIVLTPGEPAGIGPEITLKLSRKLDFSDVLIVADKNMLARRAHTLKIDCNIDALNIHHIDMQAAVAPGMPTQANAEYVLDTIDTAAKLCLSGNCKSLVTGPVHKAIINQAGIPFTGHTEYLAQCCNIDYTLMLLLADKMRVAFATTHVPLAKVATALTADKLNHCITTLEAGLKTHFNIKQPRILVCGLNPHAGDNGEIGTEEIDLITPIVKQHQARGLHIKGPFSADAAFTPHIRSRYDAIIAMYHDQGMPVVKSHSFGNAVNMTLGLPFVRTSVDHGTAFDIAAQGIADMSSLNAAMACAKTIAKTHA